MELSVLISTFMELNSTECEIGAAFLAAVQAGTAATQATSRDLAP